MHIDQIRGQQAFIKRKNERGRVALSHSRVIKRQRRDRARRDTKAAHQAVGGAKRYPPQSDVVSQPPQVNRAVFVQGDKCAAFFLVAQEQVFGVGAGHAAGCAKPGRAGILDGKNRRVAIGFNSDAQGAEEAVQHLFRLWRFHMKLPILAMITCPVCHKYLFISWP